MTFVASVSWLCVSFPLFFSGKKLVNESYSGLAKSGSVAKVIYIWFHIYRGGTRSGGIFVRGQMVVFKG